VLLKGGSEAAHTNKILAKVITEVSVKTGIPAGWLGLLETRADVAAMLELDEYIDLIVPRGSNAFVRHIMDNTRIPVMGHADGICHVYVDKAAEMDMAVNITVDSKCQYVAVCNATETLLVHKDIAPTFLPKVKAALEEKKVKLRGCDKTRAIIDVKPATEQDWKTEYLDYILSIRTVDSLEQAIEHINGHGSGHTDTIVSGDKAAAAKFLSRVDSADVFWNASTRFADGFRYGLGAEVGISTGKLHSRGPVGLEGLVIYKWLLAGNGQIVADYAGPNAKNYTHRKLNKNWKI
jgi:glutamate-5-semialdehyde dehydrogenase